MFSKIIHTDDQAATILIRLMVGVVFLSEGIQKFLFADTLGSGRFAKIGIPHADFFGPLVGSCEVVCGILILMGLLTRIAVVPLVIIMCVAMSTTKADLFAKEGFWALMHGSRTDWAMLLGSIFLFIKGAGKWSIDYKLQ